MRISDWSSDVCSSDLCYLRARRTLLHAPRLDCASQSEGGRGRGCMTEPSKDVVAVRAIRDSLRLELAKLDWLGEQMAAIELNSAIEILNTRLGEDGDPAETERQIGRAHAELQSLMRISYAVFCLKKTKDNHSKKQPTIH